MGEIVEKLKKNYKKQKREGKNRWLAPEIKFLLCRIYRETETSREIASEYLDNKYEQEKNERKKQVEKVEKWNGNREKEVPTHNNRVQILEKVFIFRRSLQWHDG